LELLDKWLNTNKITSLDEHRGFLKPITLGRPLADLSNEFILFEVMSMVDHLPWLNLKRFVIITTLAAFDVSHERLRVFMDVLLNR
jgi:hypothetical protein